MEESLPNENQQKVMKMRNLSFGYVFRPIYYFSRLFGFMPFTIEFTPNGDILRIQVTKFDIIYFVVTIFVYSLSFYLFLNFMVISKNRPTPATIAELIIQLLVSLNVIFGIITTGLDMHNRHQFFAITKEFILFDTQARSCAF